jgi:IS1 family transposase
MLGIEVCFPAFNAREIAAKYLALLVPEAIHINDYTKENKARHSSLDIIFPSHNDLRHSDRVGFFGKQWNKMITHQFPVPDFQDGANKMHWPVGRVNNVEIELQNQIAFGVFLYLVSPSLEGHPLAHARFLKVYLPVHFGKLALHSTKLAFHDLPLFVVDVRLALDGPERSIQQPDLKATYDNEQTIEPPISPVHPISFVRSYRHGRQFSDSYGIACIFASLIVAFFLIPVGGSQVDCGRRCLGWCLIASGIVLSCLGSASGIIGCLPWDWWSCLHDGQEHSQNDQSHGINVTQKYLTAYNFCNTLIPMANVLNTDKQIAVIGALAEGSSIRSIERMTGVHRDTIMRLGVKVGKGCTALMDAKMRDLPCHYLEFDEIWGFIGKKEKHCTVDDSPELGDVWTFCAVDADTKLVPAFRCGKRDRATANAFVQDVASRMKNRVQISTDGLRAYVEAVEKSFGSEVDYAQIVKTYTHDVEINPNHRYSAPEIVTTEKKIFSGAPEIDRISTSYVERLNGTTRLHMRRLTRLTLAFSKKLENFEAAVGLHFAYYNFVRRHNTLRCTPAMAAGIEQSFLSVADLIEAAA